MILKAKKCLNVKPRPLVEELPIGWKGSQRGKQALMEVVCEDDIILKNEEYIMVSSLRGTQHLSMGAEASSNSFPLL